MLYASLNIDTRTFENSIIGNRIRNSGLFSGFQALLKTAGCMGSLPGKDGSKVQLEGNKNRWEKNSITLGNYKLYRNGISVV